MHRGHGILAGLVALAAVWAYLATHPPGGASGTAGTVRVWEVPLDAVASVTYRDGGARTVLTLEETTPAAAAAEAAAPYVWIEVTMPRARGAATARAEGDAEPETFGFKGNAEAVQTLRTLAELPAQRRLGPLAALDGAAFGLPAEDAFLALARREGPPLRLELGRDTYGQTGRYAHHPGTGQVYLLGRGVLRRLVTARAALMDRNLLDFPAAAASRIVLAGAGATRTFHRLDSGGGAGDWGATPQATEPVPEVAAVVAALARLNVARYADPEEAATLPPSATLEVRLHKEAAGSDVSGPPGEPAAWLRLYGGRGRTVRAVSTHTRRPVLVLASQAQQVLQQAAALLDDS